MKNTTSSSCIHLTSSEDLADGFRSTFPICVVAVAIHGVFWIQFAAFSSVRQKGIMWLYVYLLTDLLVLFRFLLVYGQREAGMCVSPSSGIVLCYFEAAFKFYLNLMQSYILVAFNVCRYVQIVFNRNVYTKNPHLIILTHLLIYTVPMFNIIVQFVAGWTELWHMKGELCDIQYIALPIQVFNLIITYVIPVFLNLIFLALCIRHVSSTRGIFSQQIINNRRKHNRTLLFQSIVFYSIWLALWSPYIIGFQFLNVNSNAGIAISRLNYVQAAIDPVIVAMLDVRFFKAWRTTWRRIRGYQQGRIVPLVATTNKKKY